MPNYRRIIEVGGGETPSDVAIIGNEQSVRSQLHALIDAGATDIWAQPVSVGNDKVARKASYERTIALLSEVAQSD